MVEETVHQNQAVVPIAKALANRQRPRSLTSRSLECARPSLPKLRTPTNVRRKQPLANLRAGSLLRLLRGECARVPVRHPAILRRRAGSPNSGLDLKIAESANRKPVLMRLEFRSGSSEKLTFARRLACQTQVTHESVTRQRLVWLASLSRVEPVLKFMPTEKWKLKTPDALNDSQRSQRMEPERKRALRSAQCQALKAPASKLRLPLGDKDGDQEQTQS